MLRHSIRLDTATPSRHITPNINEVFTNDTSLTSKITHYEKYAYLVKERKKTVHLPCQNYNVTKFYDASSNIRIKGQAYTARGEHFESEISNSL